MSAPLIWAGLPILFGVILWFVKKHPVVQLFAGVLLFVTFTILALALPIESPAGRPGGGFIIGSSLNLLGRQFILTRAEQPVLILLFGFSTLWIFGLFAERQASKMVSYGLVILGLLIASLMVSSFGCISIL